MTNPFAFACVTPHGSEIIRRLSSPNPELMAKTRRSMERLGDSMAAAAPEIIVVLTPHGLRIDGQFSIADSERMVGEVESHGEKIAMERAVDRDLARRITAAARADGLPVGAVNFATSEGPLSCLPIDWGVLVPLYFMPDVPIVVVTPSRAIGFEDHLRFGRSLSEAVRQSGKRVGLIASCDWAHAHSADGPYGYHPAAQQFDAEVVDLIKQNDLEAMTRFATEYIENAKPDGIWQTLILAGAIPKEERRVEFLSYEVPTYFGLLCAAYHPA